MKQTQPSHSISENFDPERIPAMQYVLLGLIVLSVIISSIALLKVNAVEKIVVPQTIEVEKFLQKLTTHEQTKSLVGVAPLNIVQITQDNLVNLQSQITGLDVSYVGSYIVQYTDGIVVYDYTQDEIKGVIPLQQPAAQLPPDFVQKLMAHPEMKGLETEQPEGGQLDAQTLATLKQQFPEVYKDAKAGDYLLRYTTKLVIYDYTQDKIVNAVNLT